MGDTFLTLLSLLLCSSFKFDSFLNKAYLFFLNLSKTFSYSSLFDLDLAFLLTLLFFSFFVFFVSLILYLLVSLEESVAVVQFALRMSQCALFFPHFITFDYIFSILGTEEPDFLLTKFIYFEKYQDKYINPI